MKIERKKNAIRGTATGMVLQIVNILVPFVIRSIFIREIGIEYAGLDNLFKSILQVLNLTELGVGSALVFNMYKPISEGDDNKICALMKLYKTYYRVIGIIILLIGVAITPFLRNLIKGDIPSDLNLYILYYLNLGATVFSYWLFSYKNAILNAYQRVDIINIVSIAVNLTKYVLQIVSIFVFRNYYIYLIINLAFQLVLNISTAIVTNRLFPGYRPIGAIDKEEKHRINTMVRDMFTAKVGGVVLTSVDTIVISSFLGLKLLGIYNNYYHILTALFAFFMVLYNACRAGVANELIVENNEKKVRDFYRLTFIVFFFMNICVSNMLNLYQPFMKLWMGSKYLLDDSSVVLLCLYFVSFEIPVFWSMYKDAAGAWKQDRFRPLIGALVNLIVNIILVNIIGINGVIISTIISEVLVCIPWLLYTLKISVLPLKIGEVVKKISLYLFCITAAGAGSYYVCRMLQVNGIKELVFKLFVSILISVGLWCLLFWRTEEFKDSLGLFKRVIKRSH